MSLIELNLKTPPIAFEGASRAPDDDFWYSEVGNYLSPEQAIRVAAVNACVRVISETVASLPIHVYRRLPDGGREQAREHPAYRLLHDAPNDYETSFEFFEAAVRSILTRGAFLAEAPMNTREDVATLKPLDWSKVQIKRDAQTGIRVFEYRDDSGTARNYVDSEALFIPGPGCTPWHVKSLIEQHSDTIQISEVAQRYVRDYILKGALGPVFASFQGTLSEKSRDSWLAWFRKNFGGSKSVQGNIPIFDSGGELKSLQIDHQKMQLLDLRRFGVEEIARIFRVPPHLIQDLMRSTNNNIEHQGIEFATHTIRPWLVRIERRLNMTLFGAIEGNRYYAEFEMDGLLRGDSEAQAKILAAEIQNGVRTPNEHRKLRNLNRYDDPAADRLYIQGATVPIESAGVQQQPQLQEVPR